MCDMERLTEKELVGNYVVLKKCTKTQCVPICDECEVDKEALQKLKAYEDLEEQGLLLRLPCKVGDVVWIVYGECTRNYECLEVDGCETCKSYVYKIREVNFNVDFYDWIGKKVFLTKEEAEEALAKMTEGE